MPKTIHNQKPKFSKLAELMVVVVLLFIGTAVVAGWYGYKSLMNNKDSREDTVRKMENQINKIIDIQQEVELESITKEFSGMKQEGNNSAKVDGFFRINYNKKAAELKIVLTTENKSESQTEFKTDFRLSSSSGRYMPLEIVLDLNPQMAVISSEYQAGFNKSLIDRLKNMSSEFAETYDLISENSILLEKLDFAYNIIFGDKTYPAFSYYFNGNNLIEEITVYNLDGKPDVEKNDYRVLLEILEIKNAGYIGKDFDGDGLSDYNEITIWGTDHKVADTDEDGYNDGEEVKNGYDPLGVGKLPAPVQSLYDPELP